MKLRDSLAENNSILLQAEASTWQEAVKLGIVAADGGHFGTEYPVVSDLQERLRAAGRERKWTVECISDPTSRDMFHYIK